MDLPGLSLTSQKRRSSLSKKRWDQPLSNFARESKRNIQDIKSKNFIENEYAAPLRSSMKAKKFNEEQNFSSNILKNHYHETNPQPKKEKKSSILRSVLQPSTLECPQLPERYPTPKKPFYDAPENSFREVLHQKIINPYIPQDQYIYHTPQQHLQQPRNIPPQAIQKNVQHPQNHQVFVQKIPYIINERQNSQPKMNNHQIRPQFTQIKRVSPPVNHTQNQNYCLNQPPIPCQRVQYLEPQIINKKQTRNPQIIDERKSERQRNSVAAPVKTNLEEEYKNLQKEQENLLKKQQQIALKQEKISQQLVNYKNEERSYYSEEHHVEKKSQHIQQQQINQIQQNIIQIKKQSHTPHLMEQQRNQITCQRKDQQILPLQNKPNESQIIIKDEVIQNYEQQTSQQLKAQKRYSVQRKEEVDVVSEDEFTAKIQDIMSKVEQQEEQVQYKTAFTELKELKQDSIKVNYIYLRQMDEILQKYGKQNRNKNIQKKDYGEESRVSVYRGKSSGRYSKPKNHYLSLTKNMTFTNI